MLALLAAIEPSDYLGRFLRPLGTQVHTNKIEFSEYAKRAPPPSPGGRGRGNGLYVSLDRIDNHCLIFLNPGMQMAQQPLRSNMRTTVFYRVK